MKFLERTVKNLSESPVSELTKNLENLDNTYNKKNDFQHYNVKEQEERDLNDYVLVNRPTNSTKENLKLNEQLSNMNLNENSNTRTSSISNNNHPSGIATIKAYSENNLDLMPVPTQVENYKIMERKFQRTTTTPAAMLVNHSNNSQTPIRANEQSLNENYSPIINKFSLKNSNGLNFPQLDIGGLDVLNTPKTNQFFADELEEDTILDVSWIICYLICIFNTVSEDSVFWYQGFSSIFGFGNRHKKL